MIAVVSLAILAIPFSRSGAAVGDPAVTGSGFRPGMAAEPVRRLPEHCRSARNAVAHYRALTWSRQDKREGRRATRSPIARGKSCHWARYAAGVWVARAQTAARTLKRWLRYHYAWEEWLPDNWQRLGACETGYGRRPGNWAHANGSFVSAFGISRSIYDRDAAYNGAPPWNDANPPTPREQYLAALGHLELWGDGWTCPGP